MKGRLLFFKKLILDVQKLVEKGASKEKIGLRGPMPPGLLDELIEYVNTTDDHPLIVAAVVHYQLVAIHPEIWIHYFLWMVKLYSGKVCDLQLASEEEDIAGSLSFLKGKEKELLQFLMKNYRGEFTPIEVSREMSVTNKTIINRLAVLVKNGFVIPILVKERIRSYELSEFTKDHKTEIMKMIGSGKKEIK